MHEMAVTESILEIAVRHGQKAQAEKITDLYLVIGQLSSIVDDSIQFYWEILCKNTICEGSTLHFKRIPAELECLDCGITYTIEQVLAPCPNCSSPHMKVIKGEEFFLESIEISKGTT